MAAYTQFGYGGFPSASQLLPPNATQTPKEASSSSSSAAAANANASSLVMTNVPALSPTGGVDCQASQQTSRAVVTGAGTSTGALSPDALSQNSNAAQGSTVNVGVGIADATIPGGGSLDSSAVGTTPTTGSSCCENGRPIMTDPVSGQTVCSCQYDTARLALSSYSRLPAASVGVYGSPYPSTDQNPYQSIGVDSSAFYSPLSNPYGLKDSAAGTEMGAWTSAGLQPTTGYYSYDPMSAYGYGASYDLAARRKNATRESTATLKAWLNEHKKNPYPTKGEKIMLAIITKMTLTQVSTWFANARRRLKKENKMTWEPKNRTDDDDDALVSDDEKDKDDVDSSKDGHIGSMAKDIAKDEEELIDEEHKQLGQANILRAGFGYPTAAGYHTGSGVGGHHPAAAYNPYHHHHHHQHHQHPAYYQPQQTVLPTAAAAAAAAAFHAGESGLMGLPGSKHTNNEHGDPKNQLGRDCGVPIPATKPKIWSLADTVACKTPPPPTAAGAPPTSQTCMMPQQQQQQQQRHLHSQENLGMGTSAMEQQQQQELLQQHQPLAMGSHLFNGATPYVRAHTTAYGGFLGATTQQLHTTNTNSPPYNNNNNSVGHNNNNNSSNNNSSSNGNIHTPIIPTITNPNPPFPVARPSSQSIASQRAMAMGFPEAQPDTPPQTPPNMKVALSGALSLLPAATVSQIPMTATCRSSNNNSNQSYNTACNYPMNYSTRLNDYEYPTHMHNRDEFNSSTGSNSSSSGNSSISSSPPHLQRNDNMFRPLFKSLTPV